MYVHTERPHITSKGILTLTAHGFPASWFSNSERYDELSKIVKTDFNELITSYA